ncbi:MAG: V-type ATP synthase subunit I [Tepidanaerobacteraceae bacterium]|jgi:V/A-type H+-transporting ATPase subunit I
MAIVKMKKMHLLGLKNEQRDILSVLQKTGVVEVINIVEDVDGCDTGVQERDIHRELIKELSDLENKLNDLKFSIDFLKPYTKSTNPLLHGKPSVKKDELSKVLSREKEILEVSKAVFSLDQRFSQLKVEESRLNNQIEMMSPWRSLDIPLEQLGETQKTIFVTAIITRKAMAELKAKLETDRFLAEIKLLGDSKDEIYTIIIFHKNHKDEMQNLFKEFSVNIQDFADERGTPNQIIEESLDKLSGIEKEREIIQKKSKDMSSQIMDLEILFDYYSVKRDRQNTMLMVSDTDKTFSMEAWLPEEYVEHVRDKLLKLTELVYLEFRDPAENEDIPVLLTNSKLVEPFEVITELYSLPDPRGIDPNLYMAPFYFVFFGMMLSDAGYGIILSLLTGFALYKFKLEGTGKKFAFMLFLCGISTIVWGAIFGGWFGDLILIKPLWLNPLDNPMAVLILAFIMGVIQIYTGIILDAYKNIRAGRTADALMDQGLWLVLLTGLLMFVQPRLGQVAKYMSLFGAIGLVLTQGRSQKSIIKKFTSGILSLYDITGYLSDVLSYSRLLALGLTTGVIATVINTMAKTVAGNIIGYIVMILIIFGGHIFNLAINVLGAYVHSSRLQYIEFFSKFYESGGKAFTPLKVKTTYVELKDI